MQDRTTTVIRFFNRVKHSVTLQVKIEELAPTDYGGLWRLALETGYPIPYTAFIVACREVDASILTPVVAKIVRTLQEHHDQ